MTAHSISRAQSRNSVEPEGDWARLSAQLTKAVDRIAKRRDIVVTIAPGAAGGHKACFGHDFAKIEINGDNLEVEPGEVEPAYRWVDREKMPATWGLMIHEAAHADHTLYKPDMMALMKDRRIEQGEQIRIAKAAALLEEPRIEACAAKAMPWNRRWLRMSASTHMLGEVEKQDMSGRNMAAQAVALVGGRVKAGVITEDEAVPILRNALTILGLKDYDDLTALVTNVVEAGAGGDHEAAWMISQATAWLAVVDRVKDDPPPQDGKPQSGKGQPGDSGESDGGGGSGDSQDGDGEGAGAGGKPGDKPGDSDAKDKDGSGNVPEKPDGPVQSGSQDTDPAKAEAIRKLMEMAQELGEDIEADGGIMPFVMTLPDGLFAPVQWTKATGKQKAAAEGLRKRLLQWFLPERSMTRVDETLPPGRLNSRQALKAEAERANGMLQTATPFARTDKRMVPTPPLRVGMVVDVSGSMQSLAPHSREIAYRFATALGNLPDARMRTMLAGAGTAPWQSKPGMIAHYSYRHPCEAVHKALDDLVERLQLTRKGNARLVILITDGGFAPDEYTGTNKHLKRLIESGCKVLWIDFRQEQPAWMTDHDYKEYYGKQPPSMNTPEARGVRYVKLGGSVDEVAKLAEDELCKVMAGH